MARNEDFADYVKPFFTIDYHKNTYTGAIIHPHNSNFAQPLQFNAEESDKSDESETDLTTLPPSTRRPPGRPKKRCIRTRIETSEATVTTRVQKCGRCKQSGHSARTCKEAI